MEPLIGQITLFGGSFAPVGWAFCQGQTLSIADYTALYSLIGTTYGGDGVQTFSLPDFRGRVPMGAGNGPGLSPVNIGQMAGTEVVTLLTSQMPDHTHMVYPGFAAAGGQVNPAGNYPGSLGQPVYGTAASGSMGAASVSSVGGSQPHDNMQPWLAVNYIIALEGVYPSRN
jgi:microcystin-dependent protein